MNITQYSMQYYPKTDTSSETIEIILPETILVINTFRLINGFKTFPCGNGDDVTLDAASRLKLLKFLKSKRAEMIYHETIKTRKGWAASPMDDFSEYANPGDLVDKATVNGFRGLVPPHSITRGYLQCGQILTHARDEKGYYRPSYHTFKETADGWVYLGQCFTGEEMNRSGYKGPIASAIAAIEKETRHGTHTP